MNQKKINQWDIWYAHLLEKADSHVQQGYRPVLVISNDIGNRYSPTVTVIPLTSNYRKRKLPTHVRLIGVLKRPSLLLVEQIITIDTRCLDEKIGEIQNFRMQNRVWRAIDIQFGRFAS